MTAPNVHEQIAELDTILTKARESWFAAKTPAEERKARKQINDALDIRLDLMAVRDSQTSTPTTNNDTP